MNLSGIAKRLRLDEDLVQEVYLAIMYDEVSQETAISRTFRVCSGIKLWLNKKENRP